MPRPIFETLRDLRQGALLVEAAEGLAELVRKVEETGKGGSLSITLTVKPAAKGNSRMVVIEDEVKTKLPTPDKDVTIFFPTADGDLSRQDPAQMSLGLQGTVDKETGEILRTA